MWGPHRKKIHWNSIWLKLGHVWLHSTLDSPWPHYMILEVSWDGLWTLSLGLSQSHGHNSWLMCEVTLRVPTPLELHCLTKEVVWAIPSKLVFILFYHVWGPTWMKIDWNSIWSRPGHVWLHNTLEGPWPHYMILEVSWDGLWTLSLGLSQSWSRLLARVWSDP